MMRAAHPIDTLTVTMPEALSALPIARVVIALGSNHHAKKHLGYVQDQLAWLGETYCSEAYQNPDFTATPERPKPDYVNQCVYLRLNQVQTLAELQQIFATLEADCLRCRPPSAVPDSIRLVTMDIDILLVQIDADAPWQLLSNRVPLKAHERIGVTALLDVMGLSNEESK